MYTKLKLALALSVFVLVVTTGLIRINAVNTDFAVEEMSEKDINTFTSNIGITVTDKEPDKKAIECFDVNDNGMVVIGVKDIYGTEVCVYSPQGDFLYGYGLETQQSIGVEWGGRYVNIAFVRSDVIVSVDVDGIIVDVKRIQDTVENNSLWMYLRYSTERSVGDTKYLIRNNFGVLNCLATSHSQLVIANSVGEESIIYDVNSVQLAKMITSIILVIGFVSIAIVSIVRLFYRAKSKNGEFYK